MDVSLVVDIVVDVDVVGIVVDVDVVVDVVVGYGRTFIIIILISEGSESTEGELLEHRARQV